MVINVTNETHLDISSVVLKGAVPTANIDLATMKVTASEDVYKRQAIFRPQFKWM